MTRARKRSSVEMQDLKPKKLSTEGKETLKAFHNALLESLANPTKHTSLQGDDRTFHEIVDNMTRFKDSSEKLQEQVFERLGNSGELKLEGETEAQKYANLVRAIGRIEELVGFV